jgi:hypothetical protein
MLAIDKYQVRQNFIPNLPLIPFKDGVGNYGGVCLHATATWSTTPTNERIYETTHWENAFVHTFTSESEILQVASFDYVSWGCGSEGNKFLINCELTQDHDKESFLQAYDRWVWLAAKLLFQRKLGVIDNITLWSHDEVTKTFKIGDHTDPIDYLAYHNMTWKQVVADVSAYYKQFENEVKILSNDAEDEEKMIQELQAQLQQLQDKVTVLEKRTGNEPLADWSNPSIQKAFQVAQKHGQDFDVNEGTRDFHRIIVILDRMGLLDMALKG